MILWFYDLDGPVLSHQELNAISDPCGSLPAQHILQFCKTLGWTQPQEEKDGTAGAHRAFCFPELGKAWPWVSSTEMTAVCILTVRSVSWISCNTCTFCPRKLPQQPLSWWGSQCAALVHCNNNIIRKIPSYHAAQGQMRSPSVLIQHGFCLFLITFVGDAPITGVRSVCSQHSLCC